MADVVGGDGDPAATCREARRRRIQMRRLSSSSSSDLTPLVIPSSSSAPSNLEQQPQSDPSESGGLLSRFSRASHRPRNLRPSRNPRLSLAFGHVAFCGRSRDMEDAVSVRPFFFRPTSGPPLHFFGVFDGHGGSHVANLCKNKMHVLLAGELTRGPVTGEMEEVLMREAMKRCYQKMDELALSSCACGRVGGARPCACPKSGFASDIVGSTAVSAVIGKDRIVLGNCGDSRALLCRGGTAVFVSEDHKVSDHRCVTTLLGDSFVILCGFLGAVLFGGGEKVEGTTD